MPGGDVEAAEYDDGCVVTVPTRVWEFGYPPWTRSVGAHLKPWGLAPFLPLPAAELCDQPVTLEQVWGPAVERRFRQLVGVPPKRLARSHRFLAAVFAIDPGGPVDWGGLAARAGYADQAHFGHELRAFTGLTPTRYLELRRRFLREHPGHPLGGWPLPAG